ncbi:MAG: tRNA dihydrouridine synthase DusB [Deltaproteobacteria bacterium]|nr:tRNA dihydrouridine synthase DusB [Deltaproteobacteria bacterium]
MIKIGSLQLENWLIMAPMAGITNLPFRLMVKRMGAGLVSTELISAVGLSLNNKRSLIYLRSLPEEKPLAVQIFGTEPQTMAIAARIVIESGADLVDINMGCPVKKVSKTGAGSGLLRDLKNLEKVVSAVRQACDVPLTVKIRTGWSPDKPVACEVARIVEDCGADAITLHARFVTQKYSGRADWDMIGRVKSKVKIPVIGNGDVREPLHAIEMKAQTGCDGVMVGRAAIANPWIFRQVLQLDKGFPIETPDLTERRALIMSHFSLLSDFMGEHKAALSMRGILLRYTKGLAHSSRFREEITKIKDSESLISILDEYFAFLARLES